MRLKRAFDVADTAAMLVKVISGKNGAKLRYLLEKSHRIPSRLQRMHRDLSA